MARTSYSDIVVVHRYLHEITTFIQESVRNESLAIVLACQVFMEYAKRPDRLPFSTEKGRAEWLRLKAQEIVRDRRKHEQDEQQKTKAIRAALHDLAPSSL